MESVVVCIWKLQTRIEHKIQPWSDISRHSLLRVSVREESCGYVLILTEPSRLGGLFARILLRFLNRDPELIESGVVIVFVM